MFQAERQTTGSSYRLTLSGFNAAPSECRPVCGDGIVGIGEECDDGKNAGGYGAVRPAAASWASTAATASSSPTTKTATTA